MNRSVSWEANRSLASEEIYRIFGYQIFITAFTSARHLSLSRALSIQSMPSILFFFWKSVLILSFHLSPGLTSGLFRSGLPTKTLYAPLLSSLRATFPAHLILLYLFTQTIKHSLGTVNWKVLCVSLKDWISLFSPGILRNGALQLPSTAVSWSLQVAVRNQYCL